MSGIATAIVGSAVIGGIVSSNNASKATDASRDANAAQLGFAQQQYDDWKSVYGDIQENLASYYKNLSSDFIEAQGLEQYNKERDAALTKVNETVAQRGLTNSGIATQIALDANLASAEQRARIRAEAPLKAAQEQSRFLQIGLGQNPANNVQQVLSSQASQAGADARNAGASAGSAIAGIGKAAVNFVANNPFASQTVSVPTSYTAPTVYDGGNAGSAVNNSADAVIPDAYSSAGAFA
ncbi:hypothetical protein [Caudoviricetes sp.]|nr:hypothetical protein [Caudoviricetes sp.]